MTQGHVDPKALLFPGHSNVDVAVLSSKALHELRPLEAHIIELDGIYMDLLHFFRLFYCGDMRTFRINSAQSQHPAMTFYNRTYKKQRFNLMNTISALYSHDLGTHLYAKNKYDPRSLIQLNRTLLRYRSLTNCKFVKTSVSSRKIIDQIIEDSRKLTLRLPSSPGSPGPCIYGYHRLKLYVQFQNPHPKIKDILIQFNYIVCLTPQSFNTKINMYYGRKLRPQGEQRPEDVDECDSRHCPHRPANGANTLDECDSRHCPYGKGGAYVPTVTGFQGDLTLEYINVSLNGALSKVLDNYIKPFREDKLHLVNRDPEEHVHIVNSLKRLQCKNDFAALLLDMIDAIFKYRAEKASNVRLTIEVKECKKKLQDYIDGLLAPKEVVGGSGSVGFTYCFKLVPVYNLYVSIYGWPSKANPIDTFIVAELKEYLKSKGIDPYGKK
jgi:hypothetical protein